MAVRSVSRPSRVALDGDAGLPLKTLGAGGSLFVLLGLALPWNGWEGIRTLGPAFGLVAALALVAWASGWVARAPLLTGVCGLIATILCALRILSPPATPGFSSAAVGLCLVGSVALTGAGVLAMRTAGALRLGHGLADRRLALRAAGRAWWSSRALAWLAGVLAVLKVGLDPSVTPNALARPFGSFGNLLTAPSTAFDGAAYLLIAQRGYGVYPNERAWFPLYPTLIRAVSWSPKAALVGAIVISLAALAVALYLLHRLVALDFGSELAATTVLLVAFAPMALFFSAVYTESVFLALSVGSVYAARRGWWARAGIAGALACATRATGLVLLVPLLILYLYGPRADRPPPEATRRGLRPRYPLRADAACVLLTVVGALAFFVYCGAHGDFLAPLHVARTYWGRHFVPGLGFWDGIRSAIRSIHQIVAGPTVHVLTPPPYTQVGQLSDPIKLATVNLTDFAFLLFACVTTVGALRRLPLAYGAYALVTVLVTASTVVSYEPLESFARYLVVAFPCQMWLAHWSQRRGKVQVVLALSAGLLAVFAAMFATWRWVA